MLRQQIPVRQHRLSGIQPRQPARPKAIAKAPDLRTAAVPSVEQLTRRDIRRDIIRALLAHHHHLRARRSLKRPYKPVNTAITHARRVSTHTPTPPPPAGADPGLTSANQPQRRLRSHPHQNPQRPAATAPPAQAPAGTAAGGGVVAMRGELCSRRVA